MIYECKECGEHKTGEEYRIRKEGNRVGKCRPCEREYERVRYLAGGEESKSRKREWMAKKRASDPAAARAKEKAYYDANLDKCRQQIRNYVTRRFFWGRSKRLRGNNRADYRQLGGLWINQRGCCALTGMRLGRDAHLDHIIPKVQGGIDEIGNLQWVCPAANYAKRDMTNDQFLAFCQSVLRWVGSERIQLVEDMLNGK